MVKKQHVFHTKHDFSPELGWAAFNLLSQIEEEVSVLDLHSIAQLVASPLAKRSDLNKLVSSLQEIGLVHRERDKCTLSEAGLSLSRGVGRYEKGFNAAIHTIYFWKWIWDSDPLVASPSWSYREACRNILNEGISGIECDEIVLRVVSAAERFKTEKISFSRSSVTGVLMWLDAQQPPLIDKQGNRVFSQGIPVLNQDLIKLNLTALCASCGGDIPLTPNNLRVLSECLLASENEIVGLISEFVSESSEFLLVNGVPKRIIFKESIDPFINWIIKSACSNTSQLLLGDVK